MTRTKITDPNLFFFFLLRGQGRSIKHNEAVALISKLIHSAGFDVNYDHITTTTPKDKTIPIVLKNRKGVKKGDIAFWMNSKTLVLIEVRTFRRGSFIEVENGED